MAMFSLGTWPTMLGVGQLTAQLSANRRSQLLRLGGWVTLLIGLLTLLRTDAMVDYTGHIALILLALVLVARPLSRLWSFLLLYRRALGVGAYILSLAHVSYMLDHSLKWRFDAVTFLLPQHQLGMTLGIVALGLLTPIALTSFDRCQLALGSHWRQLHLMAVPVLFLTVGHTLLLGSQYLGGLYWGWFNWLRVALLVIAVFLVVLLRSRWFWLFLAKEQLYVPANKAK
jgi:DMSO/TMAO reductase YedYZ heme-binding membrane subunit